MSLETAAAQFLRAHGGRVGKTDFVKKLWSVEWKKPCQKVLKNTYKTCNFGDILQYHKGVRKLYCTTHGKMCRFAFKKQDKRFLVE